MILLVLLVIGLVAYIFFDTLKNSPVEKIVAEENAATRKAECFASRCD